MDEVVGWLLRMRRAVVGIPGATRRVMQQLATQPPPSEHERSGRWGRSGRPEPSRRPAGSSDHLTSALDLALTTGDPQNAWLRPYGGVLRSGDLEIAVDRRHLRISRELQTVVQLQWELVTGLVFRVVDDEALALVALTLNKRPQRVLDAAALTDEEWELVADLIAEATTGRLNLQLPR